MATTAKINSGVGAIQTSTTKIVAPSINATQPVSSIPLQVDHTLLKKVRKASSLRLKDASNVLLRLDVAESAIKKATKSLINIKSLISKALRDNIDPNDLKLNAQLQQDLRYLTQACLTQYSQQYVLAEDLTYQQTEQRTYFTIPGLDLNRFKWHSEMITLRIDNTIIMLPFIADFSCVEQLAKFNKALAYCDMNCHVEHDSLIFSLSDTKWRVLSKTIGVMGEGHRFPAGQLVPINLESASKHTLVNQVNFSISEETLKKIELMFEVAKVTYLDISKQKMKTRVMITQLLKQINLPENYPTQFAKKFHEDKLKMLFELNIIHGNLNNTTALSLLTD